jgi:hypothetical protein
MQQSKTKIFGDVQLAAWDAATPKNARKDLMAADRGTGL